ncbi:ImmA/IrrE family metallo-endopeptidase [Desertibacillus haloalkaliphilus]|uniref:ImmA/IrrE family metallo-endopeptidase n=1 Tax=Desertibacillus haloalkaliphilus TaxID=1328930 RepID=UPI001C257FCF|nr:ImmA/IrrE family metallo-endopeptidase [Desertibacillus haloalkaliphilus]MBU8905560.1 ImmA/IrrE family metallo-endopeptidase [Desertibacillus haloalkaliphilus]
MKIVYQPTALEEWIMTRYKKIGIFSPENLTEEYISRAYRIHFKRSLEAHSIQLGSLKLITVKASLDHQQQREQFYHELCHILRHEGQQLVMSKAFRELQERDAWHFTRYAAIPYHMLFDLDLHDPDIIEIMSDRFKVTPKLCHERLTKIYNNRKAI